MAGVLIVLAMMFIRRAVLRRAVYAGAVLLALVVGPDRVLLGRHFPTDVLGGWLLGATSCCSGWSFYSPLPRSHAATRRAAGRGRPLRARGSR